MRSSLLGGLAIVTTLSFAGCGLLSSAQEDETIAWSAQRLYGEAKDAMNAKEWLKPNHPNVDYAHYLKGLINFNELQGGPLAFLTTPDMTDRDPKASREAFEAFKEVVTRFPESRYAEDTAARMRYLVNALASHEVHVARYYMKRGAYLAAANRVQFAIRNYPQAPAIEEAVYILARAYDSLGITELRDAADRVMHSNFPDSRYLTPDGRRRSAPWWRIWDPDW